MTSKPKIGWLEADAITRKGIEDIIRVEDRLDRNLDRIPVKATSIVSRKRMLSKLFALMKPTFHDRIVAPDYKNFRASFFSHFPNEDPATRKSHPYIASLECMEIQHVKEGGHQEMRIAKSGIVGIILPHAITRFIQRTGQKDFDQAIRTLACGFDWLGICNSLSHHGSIFAPSDEGLICGEVKKHQGRYRPVIKTFISRDEMTPQNKDRWTRLHTLASMHGSPRLLASRGWKKWHVDALQIMLDEGMSRDRDTQNAANLASALDNIKYFYADDD